MKRCFLFRRRTEPGWSRARCAAFWLWNAGWLLLAAVGLTGATLLLALGPYGLGLLRCYFARPLVLLLNFCPSRGCSRCSGGSRGGAGSPIC